MNGSLSPSVARLAACALVACAPQPVESVDGGALQSPTSSVGAVAAELRASTPPPPETTTVEPPIPSGLEGLVRPRTKDAPDPKALPILLGRGVGKVAVGSWLEDLERELGPCRHGFHLAPTRTCAYPGWGLDIGLEAGRVARVSIYRAGREMLGAPARSKGFRGASAEGVELGMTASALLSKLGEPDRRLLPQAGPATELWVWKSRGVAVELEPGPDGPIAGALHLPRAAGRPRE